MWSACAATLLFWFPSVSAAEPVAVHIDYSVPNGCPSLGRLVHHVEERTNRARLAGPEEEARKLVVRVERVRDGFRGRLVVPTAGAAQHRQVTDASCEEVIEALGFFIALAIDPNASMSTRPPASEPPPPPESTPAPDRGPSEISEPATTATAQTYAPPKVPSPEPPPPELPSPPSSNNPSTHARTNAPSRVRSWSLGGGAGAAIVSGVAPELLVGSRALLELSLYPQGPAFLSPSVAIAGTSTTTSMLDSQRGSLALRWRTLSAIVCPVALRAAKPISFRPCTSLEAGNLRAEGVAIPNARRNDAPWWALGLSMQLNVAVWRTLELAGEVGASAPFQRSTFRYSSGEIVFRTPPLGARFGLMVVIRP